MSKRTKFVMVTGGVVSSIGKGLASASIGALMEARGLRVTQIGAEGAEHTAVDADVCGVEMRIDVVISEVAVLAFADEVGQLAQREEIDVFFEKEAVIEREPLARFYLGANIVDGHESPRNFVVSSVIVRTVKQGCR